MPRCSGRRENRAGAAAKRLDQNIVMATHAGMTTEEFEEIVKDWIATAKHPKYGQALHRNASISRCSKCSPICAPTAFKTYIVSGGGIEFMRPGRRRSMASRREQVIGSSIKTKYEMRDGKPVLVRLPEVNFHR